MLSKETEKASMELCYQTLDTNETCFVYSNFIRILSFFIQLRNLDEACNENLFFDSSGAPPVTIIGEICNRREDNIRRKSDLKRKHCTITKMELVFTFNIS